MDKREFIMSIARDLTVEVIKADKHLTEVTSPNNEEKAKKQAVIVRTLYSSLVDEVSLVYDGKNLI